MIYYAYVYRLVDETAYQKMTSLTRSAYLIGHVFSALLGQILVSYSNMKGFYPLLYIALASVSIGTCISFFFPAVEKVESEQTVKSLAKDVLRNFDHLKFVFWVLWYALGLAVLNLVYSTLASDILLD